MSRVVCSSSTSPQQFSWGPKSWPALSVTAHLPLQTIHASPGGLLDFLLFTLRAGLTPWSQPSFLVWTPTTVPGVLGSSSRSTDPSCPGLPTAPKPGSCTPTFLLPAPFTPLYAPRRNDLPPGLLVLPPSLALYSTSLILAPACSCVCKSPPQLLPVSIIFPSRLPTSGCHALPTFYLPPQVVSS